MLKPGDAKLKVLRQIARLAYRLPRFSFEARLIEYEFARVNIGGGAKSRILDVGCCESKLPVELAKQGHDVYGVDVGVYADSRLFTFVQGDIRQMPFNNEFFDAVTAVSTIEHIGLGRYGDPIASDGDREAVDEIKRVLKTGGRMIITIPCGKDAVCYSREGVPLHRVYSSGAIINLLAGFNILELSYIVKKRGVWRPAMASEAEGAAGNAAVDKVGLTSIALIAAQKEKG